MNEFIDPQKGGANYRAILVDRRDELLKRLLAIEKDFEQPRNPDDDDRAIERNNDEVLEEFGGTGQAELAAIDAALVRLDKGIFGRCVRCGNVIDGRRLHAVPHAALCLRCAAVA